MYKIILIFAFVVCFKSKDVITLRLPGPQVYVVTPSSRTLQIDEGKSAPFYYQNWMRRMDTVSEPPTTTTTAAPVKTPDLIFAEFESDGKLQKSIRNLLEKEKIQQKTNTPRPIYVPEEEATNVTRIVNYGLPIKTDAEQHTNKYNIAEENKDIKSQGPVYMPSTTTTTTTTTPPPINIENIWHIIDNEKLNQQPGNWDEVPINSNSEKQTADDTERPQQPSEANSEADSNDDEDVKIDENFALPGFATSPGNGAENESRAIQTGSNIRFPYVNLKPFQMKNSKKPILNSKKTNMFSLDNFYELKEPVRGEAQDISPVSQQIDRYNPAQPYLPKQEYGSSFSKQSSPVAPPVRATANLVPPPPPPPKITSNDFPSPATYENFPPYPPSPGFPSAPAPAPKPSPPSMNPLVAPSMEIPVDTDSSDDDSGGDDAVMDLGYRYKPPSAPVPQFLPTAPPPVKYGGYSYNKPSMPADMAPPVAEKPDFGGYHYKKPEAPPPSDDKPDDFPGYSYSKPDVPQFFDHKPSGYGSPPSYGGHDAPPADHDSDYPELIFNKPHGDTKGGDDMKANDMGMMPPPAPADMKPDMYGPPMDDHGFPSDFPGDLKFHHDFDDHDHDHYHYHHPTTTTTTTEMPRVNRYSYYYLGKKLYYLPLYFSVYFIVYVGALIIKAILRHKIVYPNSWRPNDQTASFFSKRSVDSYLSDKDNLHDLTGRVTHAIATAAEKYMRNTSKAK